MGTPFMSEIKIISWNFPPKGWAFCNGQFLPINQNQALFSLLGTMYGGNGQTTFALPNLQGRVAMHMGNGFTEGQAGGEPAHTLNIGEMAAHNHTIGADSTTDAKTNSNTATTNSIFGQSIGTPATGSSFTFSMYGTTNPSGALAPQTIGNTGGSQAHNNQQPFLVLNFVIALQGAFPSQN
jgi:microcystin-dependent protein